MKNILTIQGYSIYLQSEPIGIGKFGRVCKAISQQNQILCAKIINISNYDYDLLKKEVEVLTTLARKNHKNLIQIYDIQYKAIGGQQYCIIIMEYMERGDLQAAMKKRYEDKKWFPFDQIIKIMMDLLQGLVELYNRNIIHRDLKPANILIGDNNKITDFGMGRILEDMQKQQNLSRKGSPFYQSPQILNEQPFSSKTDIYSLGIIFYQLAFFGWFPFGSQKASLASQIKFIQHLSTKSYVVPQIKLGADNEILELFRDLIQKMISYNENDRPNLNQLIAHPLFMSVNNQIKPLIFQMQPQQPEIRDSQIILDSLFLDQNDPIYINVKQFSQCTEEMFSLLNTQNKIYHILKLIIAKSFAAELASDLLEQFTVLQETNLKIYLKTSIYGYRANLLSSAYGFSQGNIELICPKIRTIYNLNNIQKAIQIFLGDQNFQNIRIQIKNLTEYQIPQFYPQFNYVQYLLNQEQNNFFHGFYPVIHIREQGSYTIYHKWFVEFSKKFFQNYQFSTPFELKLKAALEYLLYLEQKFPIKEYYKQNPNDILIALDSISNN